MMEALLGLQDWWIFPLQIQGLDDEGEERTLHLGGFSGLFFGEVMIRSNYRKAGKGGAWFVKMDLV